MTAKTQTSPRDRLIEAAFELFYAYGLRAVSVDKVIERADTTKVTFYRHFQSKDDLVVTYLERCAAMERDGINGAIAQAGGDVDASLRLICNQIGMAACSPGFRGCPFINAAAEYPDPDSSVRKAVDTHRGWYRTAFRALLAPLELPDPAATAGDLILVRDGAMVGGYLGEPATLSASFFRTCQAVVAGGMRLPSQP